MSGYVKMGLLIGGAITIATALWIYFSPFQTCVRAVMSMPQYQGVERKFAEISCANAR
jgi:hypothetical protein